jgi:hypothetical protein
VGCVVLVEGRKEAASRVKSKPSNGQRADLEVVTVQGDMKLCSPCNKILSVVSVCPGGL